jgi:diguanylate cyclase (GGDEF)-like protein
MGHPKTATQTDTRSEQATASESEAGRRILRREFWGIALYTLLLGVWVAWKPLSEEHDRMIAVSLGAVGPLLYPLWLAWQGRKLRRLHPVAHRPLRHRAALTSLAISTGLFGAGQLVWMINESILHQAPYPSWADAAFLAGYVFALTGILLYPARPIPSASRARLVMDSLVVLASAITFSWYFLLGPTVLAASESPLGKVVSVAYPVWDLLLVCCLLLISARAGVSSQRGAVRWLMLAIALNLYADIIYTWQTLHETFQSGGYLDVIWPFAWMLFGLSVRELQVQSVRQVSSQDGEQTSEDAVPRAPAFWRMALPYALVPAVGGLVLYVSMRQGDLPLERGVYIGGAILVGLVLARQLFALMENRRLLLLVEACNAELGTKNERLEAMNRELDTKNRLTAEYMERLTQMNVELTAMQSELIANNTALSKANERLAEMATHDSMTGLANHRAFQDQLRQRIVQSHRDGRPVTLLLFDVDKFKQYNDSFGHPAGDTVLSTVGALLKETARANDLPARYGGEEFALLLDNTDLETAERVAERLRETVASHPFAHRQITVSIGVAQFPTNATDATSLVIAADTALYAAKHSGRNCICLAYENEEATFEEPIGAPVLQLKTYSEPELRKAA